MYPLPAPIITSKSMQLLSKMVRNVAVISMLKSYSAVYGHGNNGDNDSDTHAHYHRLCIHPGLEVFSVIFHPRPSLFSVPAASKGQGS